MDEDFVKKRLEKDLSELKRIIEAHFVQRQKDEVELEELKQRIEKRKEYREQQLKQRAERERLRMEAEQFEKERRAAEEAARKEEEERKKKEAMQALSQSFGGYKAQAKQRTGRGERERKKKVLAERRKPLNIDHLAVEKLLEKVKDLYEHLNKVESERCAFEQKQNVHKYFVTMHRARVNQVMSQLSRKKK